MGDQKTNASDEAGHAMDVKLFRAALANLMNDAVDAIGLGAVLGVLYIACRQAETAFDMETLDRIRPTMASDEKIRALVREELTRILFPGVEIGEGKE